MRCVSDAKNIRFLRFVLTFLLLSFALSEWIVFIHIVIGLSVLTLLFGTQHSVTTYLLNFISRFVSTQMDPKQERAYFIDRSIELFQETLRILFSLLILYLYYNDNITGAVSIAYIVGILMMISSFFGFCVSSLFYIAIKHLIGRLNAKKSA